MASNFTLNLSNPDVKTTPNHVAFIGKPGGNTLVLSIGNQSGMDISLGQSGSSNELTIKLSANVFDASGVNAITVAAPWTRSGNTNATKEDPFYHIMLKVPAGGIPLPNGQAIQIELENLEPSTKGTGQVAVLYEIDDFGDKIQAAANLLVQESKKPQLKTLLGENNPLGFRYKVNGGSADNPIAASSPPVTEQNAVENSMQLVFTFQEVIGPKLSDPGTGHLVEKWDPNKPPSFRVYFPYFGPNQALSAPLDLTDSMQQNDSNYNPYTSAWNIQLSLSESDPCLLANDYWEISMVPQAPFPIWDIRPKPGNSYLFTTGLGKQGEGGPFLNLFFSHIISGLPVNDTNPESLLFLQWFNFPGFNDGFEAYPIFKTSLFIRNFAGKVEHVGEEAFLSFTWESNADFCLITGDRAELAPFSKPDDPYKQKLSSINPLKSSYSLMANLNNGKTKITNTLTVKWDGSSSVINQSYPRIGVFLTSIPNTSYLLFGIIETTKNPNIVILNNDTLTEAPVQFDELKKFHALDIHVSPQGTYLLATNGDLQVFLASNFAAVPNAILKDFSPTIHTAFTSDESTVFAQTADFAFVRMAKLPIRTLKPETGQELDFDQDANVTGIILSEKSNTLFLLISLTDEDKNIEKGLIRMYDSNTLEELPGSPVNLPQLPQAMVMNKKEDRLYILSAFTRSFTDLSLKNLSSSISIFDIQTKAILRSVPTKNIFVEPMKVLLSSDEKKVIAMGVNVDTFVLDQDGNPMWTNQLVVFDAETLEEEAWSPIPMNDVSPMDFTFFENGDGSRLLALVFKGDNIDAPEIGPGGVIALKPILF